jgi:hypothetical protein
MLFCALTALPAAAQNPAFVPPTMGWSSWNTYAAKISDQIINGQADALVRTGLAKLGYQFVNIDDGFFANRDAQGNLLIDSKRFPQGLQPVVDYIHGLGLKAGIYTDAGHNTCASYYGGETGGVGAGIYEHEAQDCKLYFDSLKFDFIKVDFCGGNASQNSEHLALDPKTRYTAIAKAIKATGRDVQYNVCRWAFPGTWVCSLANSWRMSEDIYDGWNSVAGIIKQNLYLSAYCSPGHYNDMDMLEVGRSMTETEDQTHFAMWCMMSSPLLIGCDVSTIKDSALKLLSNEDLIAIDQDSLGLQAYVANLTNGVYTLVKDFGQRNGLTRVACVYNPTSSAKTVSVSFADLCLGGDVSAYDVFDKTTATYNKTMKVTVPSHGVKVYRLTGSERLTRTLYEAETAYLSDYQELVNNQSAQTGIYEELSACSGGMKAGWLGTKASNDLQWRDVYVPEGGEYTMTLSVITGESRDIYYDVNGKYVGKITCNTGGWSTVKNYTVKVNLQAGNNVIRLYNASNWMPDIDCMRLSAVPTAIKTVTADAGTSGRVYDLNGRDVGKKDKTQKDRLPKGVYIVDGKKVAL